MMLLIIIQMLPKSSKLLSILSVSEVMSMINPTLANKISSPNNAGDLASRSVIFGTTMDNAATNQSPGMIKIAKLLNQKITAGENTNTTRSHQYSGLAAPSKPYLGNN